MCDTDRSRHTRVPGQRLATRLRVLRFFRTALPDRTRALLRRVRDVFTLRFVFVFRGRVFGFTRSGSLARPVSRFHSS